jgi:hypothetical protein
MPGPYGTGVTYHAVVPLVRGESERRDLDINRESWNTQQPVP